MDDVCLSNGTERNMSITILIAQEKKCDCLSFQKDKFNFNITITANRKKSSLKTFNASNEKKSKHPARIIKCRLTQVRHNLTTQNSACGFTRTGFNAHHLVVHFHFCNAKSRLQWPRSARAQQKIISEQEKKRYPICIAYKTPCSRESSQHSLCMDCV